MHIMEYYPALNRNEIPICATICALKIMLSTPETKIQIHFTYMNYIEQANSQRQKQYGYEKVLGKEVMVTHFELNLVSLNYMPKNGKMKSFSLEW